MHCRHDLRCFRDLDCAMQFNDAVNHKMDQLCNSQAMDCHKIRSVYEGLRDAFDHQLSNSGAVTNVVHMACRVNSGKLVAFQGHLVVIKHCTYSIAFDRRNDFLSHST